MLQLTYPISIIASLQWRVILLVYSSFFLRASSVCSSMSFRLTCSCHHWECSAPCCLTSSVSWTTITLVCPSCGTLGSSLPSSWEISTPSSSRSWLQMCESLSFYKTKPEGVNVFFRGALVHPSPPPLLMCPEDPAGRPWWDRSVCMCV